MIYRIDNLVKISNKLDNSKLTKTADTVDKIVKSLLQIKTAQYVGVQGYWIRNERCWSNCYRQKRATSPKKSSQEIWQDCQNEYVESINNPTSGWEKYADEKMEVTLKKFANQGLSDTANKIITAEQKYFQEQVNQKTKEGINLPVAVYTTIEDRMSTFTESAIESANNLLKVAEDLKSKGLDQTSQLLASEANQIIKEALFGDFFRNRNQLYQTAISQAEKHLVSLGNLVSQHLYAIDTMAKTTDTGLQSRYLNNYITKDATKLIGRVSNTLRTIGSLANTQFGMMGGGKAKANFDALYNSLETYATTLQSSARGLSAETLPQYKNSLEQMDNFISKSIRFMGDTEALSELRGQPQTTEYTEQEGLPEGLEEKEVSDVVGPEQEGMYSDSVQGTSPTSGWGGVQGPAGVTNVQTTVPGDVPKSPTPVGTVYKQIQDLLSGSGIDKRDRERLFNALAKELEYEIQ